MKNAPAKWDFADPNIFQIGLPSYGNTGDYVSANSYTLSSANTVLN